MRPLTDTPRAYTAVARLLHWLLAALFIVQVVLAQLADRAADDDRTMDQLALLANHKSLGLTVLLFVILRIIWRLTHKPPPLPPSMPGWQRLASHVSHASLYALMIALPVSGWIIAATSTYGMSWFNLFEVPRIMAPDRDLHHLSEEIHELLGYALMILVAVHVTAAGFHHLIVRDDVVRRIASRGSIALFAAVLVGLMLVLTPSLKTVPAQTQTPTVASGTEEATPDPSTGAAGVAGLEPWRIDYEQSFIRFTGEQAGAEFTGLWTVWRADMRFDPRTGALRFDVEIDTDNASTDDEERDATLSDPDWFDVARYPVARFLLEAARRSEDGSFTGTGALTIKDKTTPVDFTFTVDASDDDTILVGRARLDRLELGVGTGEWLDTSWVGQFVEVDVRVVAR